MCIAFARDLSPARQEASKPKFLLYVLRRVNSNTFTNISQSQLLAGKTGKKRRIKQSKLNFMWSKNPSIQGHVELPFGSVECGYCGKHIKSRAGLIQHERSHRDKNETMTKKRRLGGVKGTPAFRVAEAKKAFAKLEVKLAQKEKEHAEAIERKRVAIVENKMGDFPEILQHIAKNKQLQKEIFLPRKTIVIDLDEDSTTEKVRAHDFIAYLVSYHNLSRISSTITPWCIIFMLYYCLSQAAAVVHTIKFMLIYRNLL